ncbi:hypothetical protein [Microcella humidisoli]|uniref:Uncharacterized protein n=1 Tax=Microcella humidisoli TaxID=2963406 RepID=A0ABY5FY92_9MICO|nr:hypothetical protein [Microcella humidisoli]UTT63097.1 hypothetical protein NNL39_03015 [Microcella humidisoli]
MISRRIWMPVIAGVTSIAVGVGAFAIAAPFAAPRIVEPELLDAWVLPTSSGITPLALDRDGDEPPIDELLVPTQVSTADPASAVAARSAMLEMTEEVGALDRADPEALLLARDLLPSAGRAAISADPCAALPPVEGECPDGGRATVLDLPFGPPLELRASDRSDCAPEANARDRWEFQVFSTRPVVLDITYVVDGAPRALTVTTSDEAESAWLAAGAVDFIAHCVALTNLSPAWQGTAVIDATDQTGGTARLEKRLQWYDANPIPPSWVEPITPTAVMISVATGDVATVRFLAFAVPFGEPALACDFDNIENAIEPIDQVMQSSSREQLREAGYNDLFIERHAAAFAVPEASTITVCAGWVESHTWSGNIPDQVFGEVLHSPDLAYPVISVDDADLDEWILANPVRLEARLGGSFSESALFGESYCGGWGTDFWGPVRATDYVLCDATRFADAPDWRWNNTLIVSTLQDGAPRSAARPYAHIIDARQCGIGCESLPSTFVDVPLPAQRECLGNGCAPYDRSWVRLRIDWVDGRDSWFTDWVRDDMPLAEVDRPVLDRSSGIEIGPPQADGITFPATATIVADREVTMVGTFSVDYSFSGDPSVIDVDVPVIRETSFAQRHVIDLGLVDARTAYSLVLTLTDRDGNISVYDGNGLQGLMWPAGVVFVDPRPVEVRADISVRRLDGGPVVLGEHSVTIGSAVWQNDRSRRQWFSCGSGVQTSPLENDVRSTYLIRSTEVSVHVEAFTPESVGGDNAACPTDIPRADGYDRAVRQSVRVPIEQFLSGTRLTFVRDGVEVTVQLQIEPST